MGIPSLLKSKLWIVPLLLATLANLNVLTNQFVWDDIIIINHQIPGFQNLGDVIFPDPNIFQSPTSYYRPLITLSYLWDFYFWGENPLGYHLTTLLVHLASTLMVFFLSSYLVREHPKRLVIALIASSLFAVHPIHTENVAWIAGRNDSLAAFFIFAAMLFYAKYREKIPSRLYLLVLTSLCFFFALLAKEVALSFLFLLPLYDLLKERSALVSGGKTLSINLANYLLPLLAFFTYFLLRRLALGNPLGTTNWLTRPDETIFQEIIMVLGYYLKKLLWPFHLQAFTPDIPSSLSHLLLSLLLLSASGLLFFWAYRTNRSIVAFSTAWIFITLSPSLLVAFSSVSKTPLAERYLYIPSFGFSLLIGLLFVNGFHPFLLKKGVPNRFRFSLMTLVMGIVLIPWTWTTLNQNLVWKNDIDFWRDLTHKAPEYGLPHNNLGQAYIEERRLDEAELEFKLAIQLKYENFGKSLAHASLGNIYRYKKLYSAAEAAFLNALKFDASNHRALFYYGNLYVDKAEAETPQSPQERQLLQKARDYIQQSITINPFHIEGHYDLGLIQRQLGNQKKARKHFQRVLELSTDASSIHVQKAKMLLKVSQESPPES